MAHTQSRSQIAWRIAEELLSNDADANPLDLESLTPAEALEWFDAPQERIGGKELPRSLTWMAAEALGDFPLPGPARETCDGLVRAVLGTPSGAELIALGDALRGALVQQALHEIRYYLERHDVFGAVVAEILRGRREDALALRASA